MHEKDSFGDKLKDKERGEEEQYFANRERALLEKLRQGDNAVHPAASGESRRCPKCGVPVTTNKPGDIAAQTCSSCHSVSPEPKEKTSGGTRRTESRLARSLLGTR